jgi:O-methyltransferase involved in polyketide biosynthesis
LPTAQDILNRADYDFGCLRVPYKTIVLFRQRAKKQDVVTWGLLDEHPGGVVLQPGCGLNSRFWRVDDGRVTWYGLDMLPVVELRHQFCTESERYHRIAPSVMDLRWLGTVASGGRPVLVVAESPSPLAPAGTRPGSLPCRPPTNRRTHGYLIP